MPTVIIDPGHGGMDPGAVYKGRQEKDDNLRLALAVGELLSQNGVDVLYTRTDDVYDSPYRKAMIANESGADYLISFHRNASPIAGNASGIETLVYADRGVAAQMARDINRELAALGFRDIGETLEQTVAREVMEETGIRVKNLRYYKSQPWSFTDTLLTGFFCEADGEQDIRLDKEELAVAEWIERDKIDQAQDSYDDLSLTNEMICYFRDHKDV